jgi:exosome complex RNA-binding protein Rrp42 (RNase PH superfamily)
MKKFSVTLCIRETIFVDAETEEEAVLNATSQFDVTALGEVVEEVYEVEDEV